MDCAMNRRGFLSLFGRKSGFDCGSSRELLSDHSFAGSVHLSDAFTVSLDGLCESKEGDLAISWREHCEYRWRRADVSR